MTRLVAHRTLIAVTPCAATVLNFGFEPLLARSQQKSASFVTAW